MVAKCLLVNSSALCTFLIFRAGSRRSIPGMTGRLLDFTASAALLVLGTGGSRNIPVMPELFL